MVKTFIYKICCLAVVSFVLQPFKHSSNEKHLTKIQRKSLLSANPIKSKSIPVLNINIYVMGRDNMSRDVSLAIGENIDYLNQEFEDEVMFNFDGLFLDPVHRYLPDLYDNFFEAESNNLNDIFKDFEQQGGINVFIFDTYIREGEDVALTGFTPRLKSGQESYSINSPTFDRVFISYEGLLDKSTLVHEIGHFLGLYHPWELSKLEKTEIGLFNKIIEEENHMSYGENVHEFTNEQLTKMRMNALKYRKYLCQKIVKTQTRA